MYALPVLVQHGVGQAGLQGQGAVQQKGYPKNIAHHSPDRTESHLLSKFTTFHEDALREMPGSF